MVEVTKQMVENAVTYIPLEEKQRIAENAAEKCIVQVQMCYTPAGTEEAKPLPHRYQESKTMEQMVLMGILAAKYFRVAGIPEDLQMPMNQYDEWAGSHVLNQLERLKKDSTISAKVFDLLTDYRETKHMVLDEIATVLGHHNDILWRLLDSIGVELSAGLNQVMSGLMNPDSIEGASAEDKEKIAAVRAQLDEQIKQVQGYKEQIAKKIAELKQTEAKGDGK